VNATATACRPRAIEQAIGSIDDLLSVHRRPDDLRLIFGAIRSDLREALTWRAENFAAADAAREQFDRELQHTAAAAEAVATVRDLRAAFGDEWATLILKPTYGDELNEDLAADGLPEWAWPDLCQTAERLRRLVYLDIIAAENDPVALAAALDRHYPERAA
jgi:hypothetical protein